MRKGWRGVLQGRRALRTLIGRMAGRAPHPGARPDRCAKIRLQGDRFNRSLFEEMFRGLPQRFQTLVALAALFGMLASGGGARYICVCSGTVVLTPHEHCHGIHGEEGPVLHAPPGHHHDTHAPADAPAGEEDEHHGHHHDLVKAATDLRLPDWVDVPGLKSVPLPSASRDEIGRRLRFVSIHERPRPRIAEDPPPLSHRVVRAVVRLI